MITFELRGQKCPLNLTKRLSLCSLKPETFSKRNIHSSKKFFLKQIYVPIKPFSFVAVNFYFPATTIPSIINIGKFVAKHIN